MQSGTLPVRVVNALTIKLAVGSQSKPTDSASKLTCSARLTVKTMSRRLAIKHSFKQTHKSDAKYEHS